LGKIRTRGLLNKSTRVLTTFSGSLTFMITIRKTTLNSGNVCHLSVQNPSYSVLLKYMTAAIYENIQYLLGPTEQAPPEDGDRIQFPKR
jgi:hypothetical protein